MIDYHGVLNERRNLSQRLVYGSYPDAINYPENAGRYINELTTSYLYKDIFNYQDIRKPELLPSLLEALARQMGGEVSYHELANLLKTDSSTIIRYIDLLEKSFVIFRLRSYSNNLRNELKRSRKIYFYDNGVRNALIANFNPLELRTDMGALWENFLVAERMKYLSYNQIISNRFFWRTKQQQEIDYIEERGGKLYCYEFKWNENSKAKFSKTFTKAYPDAETMLVTPKNYIQFLTNL